MTWARLDDKIFDHPKLTDAGTTASVLHIRAIVYAAKFNTDGIIRPRWLPRILDWSDDANDFGDSSPPDNLALVQRLVKAELWEELDDDKGGWVIHDFLDYNPSKAEKKASAKSRSEAARKAGLASGQARRKRAQCPKNEPFADESPQVVEALGESSRTSTFNERSTDVRTNVQRRSDPFSENAERRKKPFAKSGANEGQSFTCNREEPFADESPQVVEALGESSRTSTFNERSTDVRTNVERTFERTLNGNEPRPVPYKAEISTTSELYTCRSKLRPEQAFTLPLTQGEYQVTPEDMAEWSSSYPHVDVPQQLRSMKAWCIANPRRRKTKGGVRRFVVSWLARTQEQGNGKGRPAQEIDSATAEMMGWANDQDEQGGVRGADDTSSKLLPEPGR